MTTLNIEKVISLAQQAVNLRGAKHEQEACRYLSVTLDGDSLVYKAECFVGLILWLLVGPATFIPALLTQENYAPRQAIGDGILNGTCDSIDFDVIIEKMGVKVTPGARLLLDLMQRMQDARMVSHNLHGNRPWGEVLGYAEQAVYSLNLLDEPPTEQPPF